ncbi:RND family transporter [Motiliproteus sp. SC1-56]|uniref:efflux RND transporter permease subunit n=1 Tax=Motiliproteus sp. SC1-56 TaxID=2799565 RepID=UPI001A8FB4B1|nr:MMPL family transporter [Motiliproteus sp. SC1-56]
MKGFYAAVLRHKYWVILIALAGIVLGTLGVQRLTFKSDYRVFFGPDNPQLMALERMQRTFAKSDNVLFVLAPEDGEVFTPETLAALETLTEGAWQLPYSTRVDSITNYQYSYAEEDDLIVEDLVSGAADLGPEEIQRVREITLGEPQLVNRLVSPSGHVAGVNVTLTLPEDNLEQAVPEVSAAARALRDQILAEHPGQTLYLSGIVMMNSAFSEAVVRDSQTLVPLMFLFVMVLIGVTIRTLGGVFATVLIIVASIGTAMGLAGWAGLYLSGPSASAPTVILTLAVADCIHLLSTFYHEMRAGLAKYPALIKSLEINTQPVLLTSVTTAIGFLSMNFSDSPPFADLGNIVAVGVMLACLFSLVLFPALLATLPVKAKARRQPRQDPMERLGNWVISKRRPLLWGMSALVLVMVALVPRNELDDNFVEYFDRSIPFRLAADFADQNLTGMGNLEFELNAGSPGAINEPAFLQTAEAFATWFRSQPETVHVDSLTDTLKRLNRNMHADDPDFYRLPENRELAAQYLLLYEMSLPYGLDLNNQLNVDKSAIRVVASFHTLTSNELIGLEARARQWLEQNAPGLEVSISSPQLIFAHIGKRNIQSMLSGTLTALVLISALLGIALRSVRFGLISLVPNLAPAAMAFGLWGLLVGQVGLALSVVTGMTLGIIVDDTVHFMSKYLYARRQRQTPPRQAIRYAFSSVGRALVITTLVLATGFLIMALSSFNMNSDMGLLSAITIVIALAVDFLLLPPLLLRLDRKQDRNRTPAAADTLLKEPL